MAFKVFSALLLDKDMDVRMRLKQATASVSSFGKVHQSNTPREALEKFRNEGPIDVVFVSYQYDKQAIMDFIKEGKAEQNGQDTAYVLVLPRKRESNGALAEYMLIGADGFLFEPFSVDELVEITALATRVKKERLAAREMIAVKFLLKDLIKHLDALYMLNSMSMNGVATRNRFEQLCSNLQKLHPESRHLYFELAVDMFGRVPTPNMDRMGRRYEGTSRRVKERIERRVLSDLEREDEALN
jgi:DNA-binding NarL/FixJ family response regulator